MSKKLTKNAFFDSIDEEYSWRKKELIDIRSSITNARDKFIDTEVRKGILLLYAHWEGFIKQAAIKYLDYISAKKIKKYELKENFACIVSRNEFHTCLSSSKMRVHLTAIQSLFQNDAVSFDAESQIKTESNLSSEVLQDILLTIGLDYSQYITKNMLIDSNLLAARNAIAHGERRMMDKDIFFNTFDEIIQIMEEFKTDLQNACSTEAYKKKWDFSV